MTRTPKTYDDLYAEAKGLIDIEAPLFTNLANLTALFKLRCKWFWIGFYEVINNELVLSAFQGPPACVKISYGKGVCGKSWELKESIIVDNVNEFEGHIACNEASKAEIVIPVFDKAQRVKFIFDIDHTNYGEFKLQDEVGLKKCLTLIEELL